jgi:hypothetical protein
MTRLFILVLAVCSVMFAAGTFSQDLPQPAPPQIRYERGLDQPVEAEAVPVPADVVSWWEALWAMLTATFNASMVGGT